MKVYISVISRVFDLESTAVVYRDEIIHKKGFIVQICWMIAIFEYAWF